MKTLLISIGLNVITTIHSVLNKFGKERRRKGVLYATYEERRLLTAIQDRLPGTTLLSLNRFQKGSLWRRKATEGEIRFANIIFRPFVGLCLDEYSYRKRLARFMYENQKQFLARNGFEKVVMIDEFSMPHTMLTKAAKELGILTVAVQHGLIDKDDPRYAEGKKRDLSLLVDYMIVQSEKERSFMTTDSNLSARSVLALGFPPYDKLAQPQKYFRKTAIREKYDLPRDRKVALWLTQSHDPDFVKNDENNRNCRELFPFFKKHSDIRLVIKLHPNEDQRAPVYRQWNRKYGGVATILGRDADTLSLIAASDLVMTKHSTTAFEAALLEKPLLRIELSKNKYGSMYEGTGLDLAVRKHADLERLVPLALSQEYKTTLSRIKQGLVRHRYPNFGHAGETIAKTIKRLKI